MGSYQTQHQTGISQAIAQRQEGNPSGYRNSTAVKYHGSKNADCI